MKQFKPQLLPNDIPNEGDVKFPSYISNKLDGIRVIFKDGQMLSRALKPIPNKQLNERFQVIKNISKIFNLVFDGEIYSHNISFQKITHFVMTQDLNDEKTQKKIQKEISNGDKDGTLEDWTQLPNSLYFHCFDLFDPDNPEQTFEERIANLIVMDDWDSLYCKRVNNSIVNNEEELKHRFTLALHNGYEGLIINNPKAKYKFGRVTFKSGNAYKLKPYETFDAEIIGVVQATEVNPEAEKETNELGYSVTSRKKDDRIPVEKACAFKVMYGNQEVKVSLAMTDKEKEEVWQNRDSYIGKMIEYKGMKIGAKDKPRHPVFVRFREDKSLDDEHKR